MPLPHNYNALDHNTKRESMAVPIEFCTVVLKKAQLIALFPGGLEAFFSFSNTPTYIEDDHLVRVAFMATYEAERFLENVANCLPGKTSPELTCAVLGSAADSSLVPSWLSVGTIDDTPCAWLAGSPPGRVTRTPRSFGARFFRIPFPLFSDELRSRGIIIERLEDNYVIFVRDQTRIEALLGIDDQDIVFGLLTHVPRTRTIDSSSHDQVLLDLESTLRQLGWDRS
jgi:hypothetical protein